MIRKGLATTCGIPIYQQFLNSHYTLLFGWDAFRVGRAHPFVDAVKTPTSETLYEITVVTEAQIRNAYETVEVFLKDMEGWGWQFLGKALNPNMQYRTTLYTFVRVNEAGWKRTIIGMGSSGSVTSSRIQFYGCCGADVFVPGSVPYTEFNEDLLYEYYKDPFNHAITFWPTTYEHNRVINFGFKTPGFKVVPLPQLKATSGPYGATDYRPRLWYRIIEDKRQWKVEA